MKKFGKVFGDHHFEKSGPGFMAYGFFRDGVTLPVPFLRFDFLAVTSFRSLCSRSVTLPVSLCLSPDSPLRWTAAALFPFRLSVYGTAFSFPAGIRAPGPGFCPVFTDFTM